MLFTAEDAEERSWELAKRSVHLEPRLQRAQFAKAYSHLHRREFESFLEHAEIVMGLNPNAAYLVGFMGWAMALAGRWERGLAILAKGIELNPHYPSWFHHAPCLYHLQKGDLEDALSQARAFIMPGMQWDPLHRASILGHLGRQAQATRALTELLALDPEFVGHARQFIRGFVFQEELIDKILEGLVKAGLEMSG
jgi:adenylate cyclase